MIQLIFISLLGLCAGSFALVLTTRMYAKKDWVKGRSKCDHCKKVLRPIDLVPLLSWLSTSGTCRYCKKPLGVLYPLTEAGTALAFGLSYYFWPYGFAKMGIALFVLWLVMLTIMISLFIFDLKWFLLPDKLVFSLIGLAGASKLVQIFYYQAFDRILGIVLGVLVGAGIFYVLYVASKGRYIGGGDVTYGIFFGLLLGSGFKALITISLASLIGTAVLVPAIVRKKTTLTSAVPFGPCLILATFVMYLWGDRIVDVLTTFYLFP